jgi:hypothetical protein
LVKRDRTRQAPAHEIVVSDLMDLQARLRGDPASAVPADRTLIIDTSGVTVFEGEIKVTSRTEALEAERRMASLVARLDRLESDLSGVMERMEDPVAPEARDEGIAAEASDEPIQPDARGAGDPSAPYA